MKNAINRAGGTRRVWRVSQHATTHTHNYITSQTDSRGALTTPLHPADQKILLLIDQEPLFYNYLLATGFTAQINVLHYTCK